MPREIPKTGDPSEIMADLADQLHRTLFAVEIAALASAAQSLREIDAPVATDLLAEIRAIMTEQAAGSPTVPSA